MFTSAGIMRDAVLGGDGPFFLHFQSILTPQISSVFTSAGIMRDALLGGDGLPSFSKHIDPSDFLDV